MDRLTDFLQRFDLRARVYRSGALRGAVRGDETAGSGHVHLIRNGIVRVQDRRRPAREISEPAILFYPKPARHTLAAAGGSAATVISARVEFGLGDENPMLGGLPSPLLLPLRDAPDLHPLCEVLLQEAMQQRCGRPIAVDRLMEVLVVRILRLAIERQMIDRGVMAGLSDPRLAKALTAMHARPAESWTLDLMAEEAGMSRSRFAAHFTGLVGVPAGEYLMQWRIGLAKNLLRRGRPIKQVALEVGYGSTAAFGRAFGRATGSAPGEWLGKVQGLLEQP